MMESLSLVVLVPVLNRPHRVVPLMASFEASRAPGRLLFLVEGDDRYELESLCEAEANVLMVPEGITTWPQKIQYGYENTDECWMLCCADDVHFHPGWWQATEDARSLGRGVIGTNDLGNPRVIAGQHTTHPLVSRRYADEQGTWDGPGHIVCTEYRHCFVDDELVWTAKQRQQWAFCGSAVVEHLHPYWGKAEYDEVYEVGESHFARDHEEFVRRIGLQKAGVKVA